MCCTLKVHKEDFVLTFFFVLLTFCNVIRQRHIFQAIGGFLYRACSIFQIQPAFTFRYRTFVHTSVQKFLSIAHVFSLISAPISLGTA